MEICLYWTHAFKGLSFLKFPEENFAERNTRKALCVHTPPRLWKVHEMKKKITFNQFVNMITFNSCRFIVLKNRDLLFIDS